MEIASREDLEKLIVCAMSLARFSKEGMRTRPNMNPYSYEVAAPIAAALVQEALHNSNLRDIILGVRPEQTEVKEIIKRLALQR